MNFLKFTKSSQTNWIYGWSSFSENEIEITYSFLPLVFLSPTIQSHSLFHPSGGISHIHFSVTIGLHCVCVYYTKTSRRRTQSCCILSLEKKTLVNFQTVLIIKFWSWEDPYSIFMIHSLIMVLFIPPSLCFDHVIDCSSNNWEKDRSCKGDVVYVKLRSVTNSCSQNEKLTIPKDSPTCTLQFFQQTLILVEYLTIKETLCCWGNLSFY